MKKSLKFLLALTILSGCSDLEFWKSDDGYDNKVYGTKHAPALNNAGMAGDPSMSVASSAGASAATPSPSASSAPSMAPEPPPPPMGNDDFVSNPAIAPMPMPSNTGASPAASSGDMRPPTYNRQMLNSANSQSGPSGDLVAALPAPGVTQNSIPPMPSAQAAAMPQGDLTVPPPPPVNSAKPDNVYPRLADIPPSPPVPTPAAQDARVAQMKQDLADMQNQQANFKSSGNSISINSGANGTSVANQTPRTPGNGTNQPALIAQSPGDPYLANAQTPQVPPPPPFAQTASAPPPPPMAQQSAPAQTMNQASIMPKGPTVVVHSSSPNARPYTPQAPNSQMAMSPPPPPPPQQNMAYNPPPPPMQNSMQPPPPPPQNMQASAPANSLPRAPSMGNPPGTLGGGVGTQQSSASTNLSQLHPIAVEPAQTYASNNDAPSSSSYSNSQGLQPLPTNNIRLLPASRYTQMRTDSRDATGY